MYKRQGVTALDVFLPEPFSPLASNTQDRLESVTSFGRDGLKNADFWLGNFLLVCTASSLPGLARIGVAAVPGLNYCRAIFTHGVNFCPSFLGMQNAHVCGDNNCFKQQMGVRRDRVCRREEKVEAPLAIQSTARDQSADTVQSCKHHLVNS